MFNPRERSQPITFFVFLFIACLLLCGIGSAAPSITLSKKSGPPTSKILVSGSGFAPDAKVDIYFGTEDEAVGIAKRSGSFSQITISAPASALPGAHLHLTACAAEFSQTTISRA